VLGGIVANTIGTTTLSNNASGAAADLGRHSVADRPVACAARAPMTGAGPSAPVSQGERYASV
jgi:hypothetical protein